MILVSSCLFCCNYYVIAFNISNSGHHIVPSMRNSSVEVHALAIFEIDLPSSRIRKIEGMQRRISSLWATGTAEFQVAWLYISTSYCNRRNFHTRFDFAYFVLLAESTKVRNFSRIRKPCIYNYTSECDTVLTERKFIAYKSSRTLEYEIFTGTKSFCDYSSGLQAVQRRRQLTHDRSWTCQTWIHINIARSFFYCSLKKIEQSVRVQGKLTYSNQLAPVEIIRSNQTHSFFFSPTKIRTNQTHTKKNSAILHRGPYHELNISQ